MSERDMDLVERLREDWHMCADDRCHDDRVEAADEIERLRKANDSLVIANFEYAHELAEGGSEVEEALSEMLMDAIEERHRVEDWRNPEKGITRIEACLAALRSHSKEDE